MAMIVSLLLFVLLCVFFKVGHLTTRGRQDEFKGVPRINYCNLNSSFKLKNDRKKSPYQLWNQQTLKIWGLLDKTFQIRSVVVFWPSRACWLEEVWAHWTS